MTEKNDTEMTWRTIRHLLARGRKQGNIRPGLEAAAKELECFFSELAKEEAICRTSRAMLKDALDEWDDEDDLEDKPCK